MHTLSLFSFGNTACVHSRKLVENKGMFFYHVLFYIFTQPMTTFSTCLPCGWEVCCSEGMVFLVDEQVGEEDGERARLEGA